MASALVKIKLPESPEPKKRKLDDENSIHTTLNNLSDFKLEKILHNNSNRKSICMQGSFESSEGLAVILLEKTAFAEETFAKDSDYFTEKSPLKKLFHNDVYGNYEFFPKIDLNAIKATIIHPATSKHIQKFSIQNIYIIDETPLIYNEITLPQLTRGQFDLQWVYNILEHKSEAERIVFEDPDPEDGFVLVPDLKWDGTTLETLYLLAIVRVHDIKSLRDLTGKHLTLLKNIQAKGTSAIEKKYGLDASQLRIYLHYQPSFYHLHVHFTYLKHEAPGITAERSHLLTNVISNIELLPDYYQKVTLPFVVREADNLFKKLQEKGYLKKLKNEAL